MIMHLRAASASGAGGKVLGLEGFSGYNPRWRAGSFWVQGKGVEDISAPLILIVDENPVDRQMASTMVRQELPELRWRSAPDAAAFEEALQSGGFQAVLLDYWLHWGNGLQAAERLRERFPGTPLIFLCGEVSDAIRTQIFQFGPDDFVPKSATGFLLLGQTLRRHLEKAAARPPVSAAPPQLDVLLEQSELGRFRATPEGQVVESSSALERLLELTAPAPGGKLDLPLHFRSENRQRLAEKIKAEPRSHRSQFAYSLADGRQKWLSVAETVTEGPDGQLWIDGLVADLTTGREAANELSRSQQTVQEFTSMASHQLQEPLRMVAQYTRLLSSEWAEKLEPEAREFLKFANEGAERMQQLVDDLLAFSRSAEGELKLERCDSTQLIQKALQELHLLIDEKRAVVTWNGLPLIHGDCIALTQVFRNLISNAVKYYQGSEVPFLRVWCERRGQENWFFFRDNGPGLPEEDREKIFKAFHRGHPEVPGSGLGLPIARRIIERHGGRIWVESEPGAGATFIVAIPVRPMS